MHLHASVVVMLMLLIGFGVKDHLRESDADQKVVHFIFSRTKDAKYRFRHCFEVQNTKKNAIFHFRVMACTAVFKSCYFTTSSSGIADG